MINAGAVLLQGFAGNVWNIKASLYPFCMLTIQLPSDMPTGPPPTIRVVLWMKQPTDDSSPGGQRETKLRPQGGHLISPFHRQIFTCAAWSPTTNLCYILFKVFIISHHWVFLSQTNSECTQINNRHQKNSICDTSAGLPASQAIKLKSVGEPRSHTNRQARRQDTHPEDLCSVRRRLQRGERRQIRDQGKGINWYKIRGHLCPCVLHCHGAISSLDLGNLKWPNKVFCFGFVFCLHEFRKALWQVKVSSHSSSVSSDFAFMLTLLTGSYFKTLIKLHYMKKHTLLKWRYHQREKSTHALNLLFYTNACTNAHAHAHARRQTDTHTQVLMSVKAPGPRGSN